MTTRYPLARLRVLGLSGAAVVISACSGGKKAAGAGDTVRVAVAANFAVANDTLAQRFHASTGIVVVSTLGSTGQLYAQITNGAPIDVFLAADRERPAALERDGGGVAGTRFTYADGRLAVYAPRLASVVDSPEKLRAANITHIAIANPETAPYGAAAMDVLKRWNIDVRVAAKLVRGESIAQTLQFAESGAAEVAFVALSQVIAKPKERYWLVPATLHAPISQDAILLRRAEKNDAARRYVAFLRGADARTVIESFGYAVPDSTRK